MGLISWIKGKMKQREVRNLNPDEDFSFEEFFYGAEMLEGFKFLYCNNYTSKFYSENIPELSFISCVISLPSNIKSVLDILKFKIDYTQYKLDNSLFDYKHMDIEIIDEVGVNIYLRGDILFYASLCDVIHNNIITKYIRNNILPNGVPIETPNEFLDNMYNSINHPSKEIDILFIEDKPCSRLKPVIGLSISPKCNRMNINEYKYLTCNNRNILYIEIDELPEDLLEYLMYEVNYGSKLINIVHKGIEDDDIDSDIDEIIE